MAGTELDLRPGYDPRGISSQMMGTALEGSKWGVSMFYRNPLGWRDNTESLWISHDDTDPYLILRKIKKGYQILERYGPCPGFGPRNRKGERQRQSEELWAPILTHPEGPGEFPPDQVKTYRWYRPEFLPGSLRGRKISFPQLVAAVRGGEMELAEIGCPECRNRRTFFEPWHLAKHLSVTHSYTMDQVFALGRELGVDFRQTIKLIFDPVETTELQDLVLGSESTNEPDLPVTVTTVGSQRFKSHPAASHEQLSPIQGEPDPTVLALLEEVQRLSRLVEERDQGEMLAKTPADVQSWRSVEGIDTPDVSDLAVGTNFAEVATEAQGKRKRD